ncbi:MAG TPA: molybdate ABC transporter substrate-binding protein [Polyangia bacterium]|jgi:molybdenum ABC transporter, periplasmic molybdate-binding protein|nr:molybdate ABC transporter substrate-binding protein [Polyangia bacterium]
MNELHKSLSSKERLLRPGLGRQIRLGAFVFVAAAIASLTLRLFGLTDATLHRPPAQNRELVVFAAASLREPFETLARLFGDQHRCKVRLNLAGSQELRVQIEHGAGADVFVSADAANMAQLEEQALVMPSVVVAHNQMALIVPASNPAGLSGFADLTRAQHVVIGAPEVPVGAYAASLLLQADRLFGAGFSSKVQAHIVSRELNARHVLARVLLGEADAGIVYHSDALVGGALVVSLAIPAEIQVKAGYPAAILAAAPEPGLAHAWIESLVAAEGQALLVNAGLLPAEHLAGITRRSPGGP